MKIEVSNFRGLIPRLDAILLDPNNAVESLNTKLWTGSLAPFKGLTVKSTPTKAGTKLSIYRFAPTAGNDASGSWFHWTTDVDVVRGPIKGDTTERTYFTGDGVPKVTDNSIATSGGTNYPMNSYTLGIPAPAATIGIAISGTAETGTTEADRITRSYIMTFVSAWGEEGPPTAASVLASLLPGEDVDLSSLGAAPSGNYNIATKRIYRTATGGGTTQYYFVAEIAVATITYKDSIADSVIGEEFPSETWLAPPADMHSIGIMDNGIGYGASKNEVYISEPYLLHAWNPLNAKASNYPIIGIGSYGNTIVAITEKNPLIITGVDPSSMSSDELKINQGCLSKRSIVSGPFGVVYASPDGLVLISPSSPGEIITRSFFTRDQWKALKPATIVGCIYNNMYLGFYDDGSVTRGFIFDPTNPNAGLVYINVYPTAVYSDPLSDDLFMLVAGDIVTWDTGGALSYTWKSKEYLADRPVNLTAARILAADYTSLTFKAYVNGSLSDTKTVTDGKPFRFAFNPGDRFQFELSGTSEVKRIEIAETVLELAD